MWLHTYRWQMSDDHISWSCINGNWIQTNHCVSYSCMYDIGVGTSVTNGPSPMYGILICRQPPTNRSLVDVHRITVTPNRTSCQVLLRQWMIYFTINCVSAAIPTYHRRSQFSNTVIRETSVVISDMPHDTDYPYPIRILAFLSDTAVLHFWYGF